MCLTAWFQPLLKDRHPPMPDTACQHMTCNHCPGRPSGTGSHFFLGLGIPSTKYLPPHGSPPPFGIYKISDTYCHRESCNSFYISTSTPPWTQRYGKSMPVKIWSIIIKFSSFPLQHDSKTSSTNSRQRYKKNWAKNCPFEFTETMPQLIASTVSLTPNTGTQGPQNSDYQQFSGWVITLCVGLNRAERGRPGCLVYCPLENLWPMDFVSVKSQLTRFYLYINKQRRPTSVPAATPKQRHLLADN